MSLKLSNYKKLPPEEYEALYWELRRKNDQSVLGGLSLRTRQRLHPAFLVAYRLMNRLHGIRVHVSGEALPADGPLIFAPTHVGKFDVEAIGEAIQAHFYLLSGDFENLQGGAEQLFLNLNGVLYFRETDPDDRKAIAEIMVAHLRAGGNLLYYPEGAWNLSPNLPVLPLFPGILRVARESGAKIIPIGAEQYQKRFEVRIGKPVDVSDFSDAGEALAQLRDTMATLKWEIWESEDSGRHAELDGSEWSEYIKERLSEWPGFTEAHIERLIYKPRSVTEPEEAFAFMDRLIPCRENAFLFNKRLTGCDVRVGGNLPST